MANLTDEEFAKLDFIFAKEAPYDFILLHSNKKPKTLLGSCEQISKVCTLYVAASFRDALITVLHELAHAKTGHGHSLVWEQQFVRLLKKYGVSGQEIVRHTSIMGPALKEYVNANHS